MQLFAVLMMTLPAAGAPSAGPVPARLALLDTHDPQALKPAPRPVPKTPLSAISAASEFNLGLPSTLKITVSPAATPYRFKFNPIWRLSFVDQGSALVHDGEFQLGGNSGNNHGAYRSPFTGLWDLSSQAHADIHIGRLIFAQDETTLRLISIATTGTRTQSWQPGFVIGIGTTW